MESYIKLGKKPLALNTVAHHITEEPGNIALRVLKVRTYLKIGDDKAANDSFNEALMLVDDQTNLFSRLELSFLARKLSRDDAIIDLLRGRIATDRESEGLKVLILTSINSGYWATARETLNSISSNLRDKKWYKRAEAVLSINTGDSLADSKIAQYLKLCPNDLEMIVTRIEFWQSKGRDSNIRSFLQHLNLADINGCPEIRIKLASLICRYEDISKGLQYAYSVLMDNWDTPQTHLAYQGLIFFGDHIEEAIHSAEFVAENTVVCLLTEDGERRYRIETQKHVFFEDERLSKEDDLAVLLIGKRVGEKFKIQDITNSNPVEVIWIKSIYLDAFHRSLEQFNKRFPRAVGLQRFNFDTDSTDPIEDIREIVKVRAEAGQHILDEYQKNNIPFSFIATFFGEGLINAYIGLPTVDVKFKACYGFFKERENALQTIQKHEKKGCVLDAITLSVVRRLGVEKTVVAICGPIYTSKSVIDFLVSRAMEARQNIRKKQGFISWHNDRLVFEGYKEETLKNIADELEREVEWARSVAIVAPAMPKCDFKKEVNIIIDKVGRVACDPAIVAEGNDLLLLSEDLGFRTWSKEAFNIPITWLQPVLMVAREKGYFEQNEYCEAINLLVLSGHTYVSLDPNCLMHQARKDKFILTNELICLLKMVGGPSADLNTNTGVLANFIDMLWQECPNDFKIKIIASESFNTFVSGRQEDQYLSTAKI